MEVGESPGFRHSDELFDEVPLEATVEALEALGYLQDAAPPSRTSLQTKVDDSDRPSDSSTGAQAAAALEASLGRRRAAAEAPDAAEAQVIEDDRVVDVDFVSDGWLVRGLVS